MAPALKIIAAFPLLFFIPGLFLLRLVGRRGGAVSRLDSAEYFFLAALISAAAASWTALILAQAGCFSLAAVCAILLIISAALLIPSLGKTRRLPLPGWRSATAAALFGGTALFLYSPPYEYVLGIWDPGVYVNAGARLARTGSITFRDRALPLIPASEREIFYDTRFYNQKYEGMAVTGEDGTAISPHFYHLYTAWIGVFNSIGGFKFSLRVNAVFGLLCLAALYLLSRELAGRGSAFLAALLLLFSAAQVWAARFPDSEIIAQFFILSWLLCLVRAGNDDSPLWPLLGGACLALALLTVFTAVILLPLFLIVIFWRSREGWRGNELLFMPFLLAGVAHLVIQDLTVCRSYVSLQFRILGTEGITPLLLTLSGAVFILLLFLARWRMRRLKAWVRAVFPGGTLRLATAAAIVCLFFFAYYIRPRFGQGPDVRNLRELGWFLYPFSVGRLYFPLGQYLALLGVVILIIARRGPGMSAFLFITLACAVIMIHRKMIFPSYPWAMRRYIPLIYPSLIFFMAFPIAAWAGRARWRAAAATALVALLIACAWIGYGGYLRPAEYSGTADFLARLASRLDRGGVYICEGSGIAAPLDCVYGLDVLHLRAQTPGKCRRVEKAISGLLAGGRRVYYISRGDWPVSMTLDFIPVFSLPLETDHLDYAIGTFSGKRAPVNVEARVFKLEPLAVSARPVSGPRTIDVGENAFGLISGFYPPMLRETKRNGRTARHWVRWTEGTAEFVIPTLGPRRDLQLTLRATCGKNRPDAPVPVTVYLDGRELGVINVGRGWGEHDLTIPASLLAGGGNRAMLKIDSPVWEPRKAAGTPRGLGICLDWVRVSAGGAA